MNVLDAVGVEEESSGSGSVYTERAQLIRTFANSQNKKSTPVLVEAIEFVPGSGKRLRRGEVSQMNWGTKETVDIYKAMILDMNADQLRFALLMIINGNDPPYAIDQALAIYKQIKL